MLIVQRYFDQRIQIGPHIVITIVGSTILAPSVSGSRPRGR